MKESKDPFEASLSDESPPESPVHVADQEDDVDTQNPNPNSKQKEKGKAKMDEDYDEEEDMDMDEEDENNNNNNENNNDNNNNNNENNNEDNDNNNNDDDDNGKNEMDGDTRVSKMGSGSESTDPHKMAKMQSILSQFTEEQMTRYESFRRSGFQKSVMKRLLVSITGSQKISVPMTIVVAGIAKMFVGELVETARVVMAERKDSGPIRPCHIRESYRRLKLEGKIPKKSVPRLFK